MLTRCLSFDLTVWETTIWEVFWKPLTTSNTVCSPGSWKMLLEWTGPNDRGVMVLCKVWRTALGWMSDYKRLSLSAKETQNIHVRGVNLCAMVVVYVWRLSFSSSNRPACKAIEGFFTWLSTDHPSWCPISSTCLMLSLWLATIYVRAICGAASFLALWYQGQTHGSIMIVLIAPVTNSCRSDTWSVSWPGDHCVFVY